MVTIDSLSERTNALSNSTNADPLRRTVHTLWTDDRRQIVPTA